MLNAKCFIEKHEMFLDKEDDLISLSEKISLARLELIKKYPEKENDIKRLTSCAIKNLNDLELLLGR